MLLIGLTGSIASGKSTVSTFLSQLPYNLPIIDADVLARLVVEPGTSSYTAIVRYFSSSTPDLLLPLPASDQPSHPRGALLNRAALGRRVFGDDPQRRKDRAVLNGIVHPAVRWEIYKALVRHYLRGEWAVVLDVPLLLESGLDLLCGVVVVVAVRSPEVLVKRLLKRDEGLTEADAWARLGSQRDIREKARWVDVCRGGNEGKGRTGFVIWNDAGKEELRQEVDKVMKVLRKESPTWWALLLLAIPPFAVLVGLWNVLQAWRARRRWRQEDQKGRL